MEGDLCKGCKKRPRAPDRVKCAECLAYHAKYMRDHYANYKEYFAAYHSTELSASKRKSYRDKLRSTVLAAYGGMCTCCGETTEQFLCIDHINNDGAKQRKELFGDRKGSGTRTYKWLRDNGYPTTVQILCWNCNSAKAHYGICPHQVKLAA